MPSSEPFLCLCPMSYKPEVFVEGKWSSNSLRFATEAEADASVRELMSRWWVPSDGRATECSDPVNYRFNFEKGKNEKIETEESGAGNSGGNTPSDAPVQG